MELELKSDFERARRRWDAFWRGEALDRPIFQIVVRKPGSTPAPRPYPVRPDRDPAPQIDQTLAAAREYEYLAEAIPTFMLEFGPEHFAALLGSELRYPPDRPETGWALPFVEDWDDAEIALKRDSFAWQRTIEFVRAWRARCDGTLLVNAPVLSAGLDALAAIRGPQRLLLDLIDCPPKVHRALEAVRRAYHEVVTVLAKELGWLDTGSADWNGMYCSGWAQTIQCDFSCMIGRERFGEFAVPCLHHQAGHYEAVTYHLDGPQAAHHLEAICAIPEIGVIQYVPVPGETPEHVEGVYRDALSLGKGVVRGADPETIRRMWDESPDRRLVFSLWMGSRKEAEEFLASFD